MKDININLYYYIIRLYKLGLIPSLLCAISWKRFNCPMNHRMRRVSVTKDVCYKHSFGQCGRLEVSLKCLTEIVSSRFFL